tara:strand:+ start:1960 stop:2730 length:771 start_codon:yes stop_codon:yes gene_type:complete
MKLNLFRPLCFFDLETTGINITNDRIVEIGILKIFPDGKTKEINKLVNPEMTIPKEVSDIHGITNEKVDFMPTFKQISKEIYSFIQDSDLAGFNSDRFDIPLLVEEFLRAEIDFNFKKILTIDVQTIFHKMEQRTLSAALKFYCKSENEKAHSAMNDTRATYDVLMAQLEKYSDLEPNVKFLNEFSSRKKSADYAGFIIFNDIEKECFGFGKYKGKEVEEVLKQDPGYFGWVLKSDFPRFTKKILTEIRLRNLNTK